MCKKTGPFNRVSTFSSFDRSRFRGIFVPLPFARHVSRSWKNEWDFRTNATRRLTHTGSHFDLTLKQSCSATSKGRVFLE